MNQKYILLLFLLFSTTFGFAQETILCPEIITQIKIDDTNNIPVVTDNGDGTVNLIHPEQYISDIFANYIIYDFHQYSPNSNPSGELFKYYTIAFQSKDLINNMKQNIPIEVFDSYSGFDSTPIDNNLTNFLDGKTFKLTEEEHTSDRNNGSTKKENVPNDFNLKVDFNYDPINDLLEIHSSEFTPCGNSFSISFKGGTLDNTLQLWKSTPGTITPSTYEQSCTSTEQYLYQLFDISCHEHNFGDIFPTINTEKNTLTLKRNNAIFGDDTFIFEEDVLSIKENNLENIKLFTSHTNPYIEFAHIKESDLFIEVFSILGKEVIKKTQYKKNSINLNTFSKGLYILRLSNSSNAFKTFKYLN